MVAFCQLCFKEIMMMMMMSYHYCQILHYQFATGVLRSTNHRNKGDTSPSPAGHAQYIERPDTDFKGDVQNVPLYSVAASCYD